MPASIIAIKVIPSAVFRAQKYLPCVQQSVQYDGKHSKQRQTETQCMKTFQETERDDGEQRPGNMIEESETFQLGFVSKARPEENHYRHKGNGNSGSSDIFEQPHPERQSVLCYRYRDKQSGKTAEQVRKKSKITQSVQTG